MPKRVLGNDPFQRGAAHRADVAQPEAPQPKKKKAKRTPTPELQVPPTVFEEKLAPPPSPPEPIPQPIETPADQAAAEPASPPPSTPSAPRISIFGAARRLVGAFFEGGSETQQKDEQLARALRPLADALYERYWRVEVHGAEKLPEGASVLAVNHVGSLPLDGAIVHLALKRNRSDLLPAQWLMEDQPLAIPLLGSLALKLGALRSTPDVALRLLGEGRPIIVFPEGAAGLAKPFGQRYQLQRFGRGGYVKIAARARVPIVPVAIVGGEETTPLLGKVPGASFGLPFLPLTTLPLPTKWHLRFGEPIDPPTDYDESDPAWADETNEQVRTTIASMIEAMLSARRGIFR